MLDECVEDEDASRSQIRHLQSKWENLLTIFREMYEGGSEMEKILSTENKTARMKKEKKKEEVMW